MSNARLPMPRDVREFIQGYPDNRDDPSLNANLEFYSNQCRCQPDNMLIDDILSRWRGDYATLEYKHGFIQWLFPIQEYGMNYESQPLQPHEISTMRADPDIVERVTQSYRLMLDFYGMQLANQDTGLVSRADNYKDRYRNLIRSSHNYLRISRILKCLSELGLERLNAGFLLHVLNEQSEHGTLNAPALRNSMDRWWANCLRNEVEREWINNLIEKRKETGKLDIELSPEPQRFDEIGA
ncbi:hypothetical protein CERSUDRAFT_63567 [Gelatoporia subvermispora B]|uniref:Opioid growth factor receptor (OGFr) conserved domain-containing protein n=1 Tax=Ceriporiopsis subvermispora (strain B) TaxID=914234 RepID=M2QSR8_CERS8|nr:hypothetical protein CERSUDRAFT_63567 [Gelatoporia subvermispora B]